MNRLSERILGRLFILFSIFGVVENRLASAFFKTSCILDMRNRNRLFAGFHLHVFGQVFELDDSTFRKHNRMLHDVFELADVAGVGVLCQSVKSRRFKVMDFLALRFLVL